MSSALILVIIFGFLPAALGYCSFLGDCPTNLAKHRERLKSIRHMVTLDYALWIFIFSTAAFYIVGGLAYLGVRFSKATYLWLLMTTCLGALVYLWCYMNIWRRVVAYGSLIKAPLTIIAVGVVTLSKIYSDATIAELSGFAPQDLPAAQLLLTLIFTPAIWLIALSLGLGYASIPAMGWLLIVNLRRSGRRKSLNVKPGMAGIRDPAALAAVPLFAIMLLTLTGEILSERFYAPKLRDAIAFASFHLPTSYCGLPDVEGVGVAPMPEGRGAVAIPAGNDGHRFVPIICQPRSKTADEVIAMWKQLAADHHKGLGVWRGM